jgi:hypothetical protein
VERRRRIWRTVVISCVAIAVAAVVLASIDAEEESRAGAATVTALMIGLYIRRQRELWQEEGRPDADGT